MTWAATYTKACRKRFHSQPTNDDAELEHAARARRVRRAAARPAPGQRRATRCCRTDQLRLHDGEVHQVSGDRSRGEVDEYGREVDQAAWHDVGDGGGPR